MKSFRIAFASVIVSAFVSALSCTPLPDLDDDKIVGLPDLGSIDAAACDSEAAPSICDQLRR